MRLYRIILLLLSSKIHAATYYVSNAGNDALSGTSTSTSWQTIAKINSYPSFVSGDSVLLKAGDTWIEALIVPVSGLKFGSYGTGLKPHITGFKTLTGLTNSGNIWSATTVGSVVNQNTVLINGQIRAKARYPNTGYLTAVGTYSTNQVIIPHTVNNYSNGELVTLPQGWVIDVTKITQHKTGATNDTLVSDNANGGSVANTYFLQNKVAYLDTANEWIHSGSTLSVYASTQPSVQYSILDTLVKLHRKSNVSFNGIAFSGANNVTIFADSCRYDTIINCTINNNALPVNADAINGLAIISDSIQNSLSSGYWISNDTALYIYKNYFNNSGIYPGMGGNGYSFYGGGFSYSNGGGGAIIRENTFKNSGYHGFRFVGINTFAYRNNVDTFCLVKNDGGGIYTYTGLGNGYLSAGSIIRGNTISNGFGTSYGGLYAQGIYLDDGATGILVDSNVISNVNGNGVQCTGSNHIFRYNLIVNAGLNATTTRTNFWTNTTNLTFKGNVLSNTNATHPLFLFQVDNSTATMDSNYYLKPVDPATIFSTNSVNKSFATWKSYYATYDVHSSASVATGSTSNTPVLYTNPTGSIKTITVSGGYSDVRGFQYENSVQLLPFQSVLLYPSNYKAPTILNNVHFKF